MMSHTHVLCLQSCRILNYFRDNKLDLLYCTMSIITLSHLFKRIYLMRVWQIYKNDRIKGNMIVIFPSRKRKDFLPFWTIYVHLPLLLFPSFCFHLISIKALPFEHMFSVRFKADFFQNDCNQIFTCISSTTQSPRVQSSEKSAGSLGTNKKNGVRTGGILFVS